MKYWLVPKFINGSTGSVANRVTNIVGVNATRDGVTRIIMSGECSFDII
jgi:hypothetical protein